MSPSTTPEPRAEACPGVPRGPGRPSAAHSQTVRALRLLRLLEATPEGRTLTDLADTFEVTTRTIRRDLAALRSAGEPIERAGRCWRRATTATEGEGR